METRRKLNAEEQELLALRLEDLYLSVSESYEYPLKDLIDNLRNPKQRRKNEVEEMAGKATKYFLRFSSPDETWEMLCGRAGIYTVDAESLKAIDFQLTLMN